MQDEEKDIELEAENNEPQATSAFGRSPDDSGDESYRGHGDAEHKIAKLKQEIEKIKKERQEYLDGWQRSKADYVNLLKRSQQETGDSKQVGIIKAVETLLPAFDALERASERGDVATGGVDGITAVLRLLRSSLGGLGAQEIGEVGEAFDPNLHEALGQDKAESAEADDTITQVLEKGWKIGDAVIRPAKVRVAHWS